MTWPPGDPMHSDADGIRRLMGAVLIDNLRLLRGATRPRVLARELGWLMSDDHSGPFAFRVICSVLDIPADRVRRAVLSRRRFPGWMVP